MKIMQTEKHHSLSHPRSNFMGWGHKFDIILDNKTPLSVGCFFCSIKCPPLEEGGNSWYWFRRSLKCLNDCAMNYLILKHPSLSSIHDCMFELWRRSFRKAFDLLLDTSSHALSVFSRIILCVYVMCSTKRKVQFYFLSLKDDF